MMFYAPWAWLVLPFDWGLIAVNAILLASMAGLTRTKRVPKALTDKIVTVATVTAVISAPVAALRVLWFGVKLLIIACPRVETWLLNRCRVDNYQTRIHAREIQPMGEARGPHSGNEHQADADARAHATVQINSFISRMGATPYFFQMAACDQRRGHEGVLKPLWAKDLVAEGRTTDRRREHVAVYVDVDYYLNLNEALLEACIFQDCKMLVLYTFIPEAAARNGCTSFCFDSMQNLNQVTAGGSIYKHELWNHGRDVVVARDAGNIAFFNVERLRIATDRYVVVYSAFAFARWSWTRALMEALDGPSAAVRLAPVKSGWTTITLASAAGIRYSVGRVGEFACATVEPDVVASMRAHRSSLVQATLMNTYGIERTDASVLVRWSDDGYPLTGEIVQNSTQRRTIKGIVQHYMATSDDPEKAKTSLRQIANPPVPDQTYVPMRTPGNLDRAVITRAVLPQLEAYEPDVQTVRFVEEWTQEMIRRQPRDRHPLAPEEVELVQNSAQQKRLFAEACAMSPKDSPELKIETFMKAEPYQKLNDPRVISPSQTDEKRDLACFIYAFSEHYKSQQWFGSAKTPIEVSRIVASIAMVSRFVTEGDDSRRDGRWRELIHRALALLVIAFFHAKYTEEIRNLMQRQTGRVGKAGSMTYETLWSLLSGSAITTVGNTLLSLMESSYGFHLMGFSVKQAIDMAMNKGIYSGDDSLVGDLDSECFTDAVTKLGQSGKTIRRERGQIMTFLGRVYGPQVWHGDLSSMRDILRALRNICVAKHGLVPADAKFVEKVKALALADRNTPILCWIVQAVERLTDLTKVVDSGEVWSLQFSPSEQYPNEKGDWMQLLVPEECDWDLLRDHCASSTTIQALREFPLVKEPVSTDQVLVTPAASKPDDAAVKAAKSRLSSSKGKEPVRAPTTGPERPNGGPGKAKPGRKRFVCIYFNSEKGCSRDKCNFEHRKLSPAELKAEIEAARAARKK